MSDPTCGCCEGISAKTPAAIDNRPGLAAISYRSGTWGQFKATMLDALSTSPELSGLRTRTEDDFTIALLDAWAVVCDILTYYQERIANESYLRTATERVSVGELAKLIGYKLRPGLAASVALSFTMDVPLPPPPRLNRPPDGSPPKVVLDAGIRAQSIPDPGRQPATFETVAPVTARAKWNAIRPRLFMPLASTAVNARANLRLSGLVTSVRVGDRLLAVATSDPTNPAVVRVAAIDYDTSPDTPPATLVTLEEQAEPQTAPLPWAPGEAPPGASLDNTFLRGHVKHRRWQDQGKLAAFATSQNWSIDALEDGINALRGAAGPGEPPLRVFRLGVDASLFGHNAVDWYTLPDSVRNAVMPGIGGILAKSFVSGGLVSGTLAGGLVGGIAGVRHVLPNWEGYTLADLPAIDLDNTYPVVAGRHVVLEDPTTSGFFASTIASVAELSRTGFLQSAKVTRIALGAQPSHSTRFGLRTTHILVETEELPVADAELTWDVGNQPLMLDGAYLTLQVGQLMAVTGVRADTEGETASEVVAIASLSLVDGYTVVTFSPGLTGTYRRASVTINANVAPATHGQTTSEILGSGDASQAFQRFALKQAPLTYVSAATARGATSTLVVRVDGVRWTELPWLYGSRPGDRVYTVVAGSDDKTYVQFGDGVTGARPGSGTNNIQATYRTGIGSSGLARAGQISMLLSRPLGLKGVTNPLASSGAADPETIDQARPNAPMSVRSIDGIVSLEDFGDFAAASAGIAKAGVAWVWDGRRYVACVTVAGADGAAVPPGSSQYTSLLAAMHQAGDGTVRVTLCSYVPRTFRIAASVTPDPALVGTAVLTAVKQHLADVFSFRSRAFTEPVFRGEVIAAVQEVPGVVAMTLSGFDYSGAVFDDAPDALTAAAPTLGPNGLIGAELLTLEPGTLPGVVLTT